MFCSQHFTFYVLLLQIYLNNRVSLCQNDKILVDNKNLVILRCCPHLHFTTSKKMYKLINSAWVLSLYLRFLEECKYKMKIQFLDRAIYLRNMALITIKESQPPTAKTPNTPPATLSPPQKSLHEKCINWPNPISHLSNLSKYFKQYHLKSFFEIFKLRWSSVTGIDINII